MKAFVHPTAVVDEGAQLGEGTRVWHFTHIEGTARVGKNCTIGQNVYIGRNVVIGDNCKLQNNVSVYEGVTLGNGVFCGPSCVFTNDLTPRALFPKGGRFLPTLVKDGASIGANATVVCGNEIGRNAMIAAGAVVTGTVAPHRLMRGVPARPVGHVCVCGARLDRKLNCAMCGRRYESNPEEPDELLEAEPETMHSKEK